MPRIVRGGLIQATLCEPTTSPIEKIKAAMIEKHVALIAQAAGRGAQVVCMQELFYGPYFCAEQETKCYDRHFPEGARCLGLNGAEIVFNPSATVAGLSEYLWKLEQPAHAVANQYYVGAINRPGFEEPWRIGEFYGQSYFCDPRGQMLAVGKRDADDIVIADLDLDLIREVRNVWQFFRDRRPESYGAITQL